MSKKKFSLLYPKGLKTFNEVSEATFHDLGLDLVMKELSDDTIEQRIISRVLCTMSADPDIAQYRCDIFKDLYDHPLLREQLVEILQKIDFLKEYGRFKREFDEKSGMWDLMHRLDEIQDYIRCVEAIHDCLSDVGLKSQGLHDLREYVDDIFTGSGFAAIKKDISNLELDASKMKSVTVGINLNERFEASSIGLISVNTQYFTKSTALENFFEFVSTKDRLNDGTDWDEHYTYHPFTADNGSPVVDRFTKTAMVMTNPLLMGLAKFPGTNPAEDVTFYMDCIVNNMLSTMVKRLRDVLNKYVTVTITDITDLIPEFIYYVRFAEYIRKLTAGGAIFCRPVVSKHENERNTQARGIYNLKLAAFKTSEHDEIVVNDIDFGDEQRVYILTGANRGGKTTITQAVGQLFMLAQGGIFVPGTSFVFTPVDNIFTHFPADEDKTMDLGRLGEECKRFRELYRACTNQSLLLLNETFSTTSFEEGYYIAKDTLKAILKKGITTIYTTHMHRLALEIEELNRGSTGGKAQSLVVKSDRGKRSFKIVIAEPEGHSYAKDIAEKYGVTFEMLTNDH
ncbi:MAG: DNA mismatch repair protein [Bacteroidia bacterium]|nr:DNA mismatch repair protein [Bacteroidia bacterium]